jgi:hypothetical protein
VSLHSFYLKILKLLLMSPAIFAVVSPQLFTKTISRSPPKLQWFSSEWAVYLLVGGLDHFLFFHILGTIIPTDFHIFQRGRYTTSLYIPIFVGELPHSYCWYPSNFSWSSPPKHVPEIWKLEKAGHLSPPKKSIFCWHPELLAIKLSPEFFRRSIATWITG